MSEEFKIELLMNPHYHDNVKQPYFWAILQYVNKCWINTGHYGWAETPFEAFLNANYDFNNMLHNFLKD